MYSYEERIRAVKLYIELGKRTGATIRQLGYPTKNALKGWHRHFEEFHDLPARGARRRPKYSDEQKQAAVEHYMGHGRSFAGTIAALGYPGRAMLVSWIDECCPGTRIGLVGKVHAALLTPEARRAAVMGLCTRQGSAEAVALKVGVRRETLYNWKNRLLSPEALASMKQNSESTKDPEKVELEQDVESLRRAIRQLQLEHDLLKKANELLKKEKGIDLQLLSNREKTLLVDALRPIHALSELLARLGLPRSCYFYHRARLQTPDRNAGVRHTMAEIFSLNHRCYGYRRMRGALGKEQIVVSEKVVQRLMRQENLVVAPIRRRRYRSYQGEISPAPENLINRDFQAAAPNEKWLTDITEFQIPAGKVYLSPVIDCFDGLVISWTLGTRPDADLVNTMLDAAIETVARCEDRPVVHSDRGAHYRWPGWLSRIQKAKLIRSMSRKGCSPDNAACEGFFGRLKTELFYPRDWRTTTLEQFMSVVDSYIRWYNEKRIKISLGSLSPLEYRASLGLTT